MFGHLDSLDVSGHICINSDLRVALKRINSGLRVMLTQGVLTAYQRLNGGPAGEGRGVGGAAAAAAAGGRAWG
eukprot:4843246-Prymnesium_polylepis.1